MTRLSIVTITYNDSAGLQSTMSSLPLDEIEWIVIDGSSDSAVKTFNREILADRFVTLVQEPDSGIFDAMNKGLALATGELLCFLNGGDQFASLQIPRRVIDSYEESRWRWAVGEAAIFDGDNSWSWNRPAPHSLRLRLGINSYCHQATFVETESLREVGGFALDSLFSDWSTSLLLERIAAPYLFDFTTTNFLANGISGQQSVEYWRRESVRLRRKYGLEICGLRSVDSALQWIAAQIRTLKNGAPRQD